MASLTGRSDGTTNNNADQVEEEAFFDCFSKYMEKKGFFQTKEAEDARKKKADADKEKEHNRAKEQKQDWKSQLISGKGKNENLNETMNQLSLSTESETTLYQVAVKRAEAAMEMNKMILENIEKLRQRTSTSSEEDMVNTSDESILEINNNGQFEIAGSRKSKYVEDGEIPQMSHKERRSMGAAEERRDQLIQDAEQVRARIFEVSDKPLIREIDNSRVQVVLIDEEYISMGSHLEPGIKQCIEVGAYVDLARLLPRDKVFSEEDHRLEMVNKGGMTYWVPVADRELTTVSSYIKWEQAFRVYLNIFAKANPERVTELLQYNHVIETVAASYPWSNVYKYDREFRIHMSEHPERNWGIILQQAWALYIKSGTNSNSVMGGSTQASSSNSNNNGSGNNSYNKKICFRYNRGKCTFGIRCKFDHRCGICGKSGHGAFNCRRVMEQSDRDKEDYNHSSKRRRDKEYKDRDQGYWK